MRLLPTSLTQRAVDPNDPTGGTTIDALRLRQRALQQAAPQAPAQIASPWQGASFLANSFANDLQQKQATAEEAAGRQKLAQLMGGIDMNAGATSQQMADISSLDPDLGSKLWLEQLAKNRADADYKRGRADTITDREDTQAFELEKAGLAAGQKPPQGFSTEQDLRKEYTALPLVKNLPVIQTGYERMTSGAADDSPVGDIALIYGFMKLQDPESVVREGEYATAQNAAGIPDRVQNLYNQAIRGVRLTPEQRTEFLRVGGQQYRNVAAQVGEVNNRYTGIAKNYGIEPGRVVVAPKNYDTPEQPPAASETPAPPADAGSQTAEAPAPKLGPPQPAPSDVRLFVPGQTYIDEAGNVATFIGGNPNVAGSWKNAQPRGAQ